MNERSFIDYTKINNKKETTLYFNKCEPNFYYKTGILSIRYLPSLVVDDGNPYVKEEEDK